MRMAIILILDLTMVVLTTALLKLRKLWKQQEIHKSLREEIVPGWRQFQSLVIKGALGEISLISFIFENRSLKVS